MRTPEEDAECRRIEAEFEDLRVRLCGQVEAAARRGADAVVLEVADVRQLLHVLSITPFKVKTMEEATAELSAKRRERQHQPLPQPLDSRYPGRQPG